MPLYFQTDISVNDIYMNDRVFFSYPEAEDKVGGKDIIRELRTNTKRIPIRICSSFLDLDDKYRKLYSGMWDDSQQESKLHLFREDLQNLKNKLDQNALVCFYIAEWQEIITKLQKYSPEIFEIVVEERGAIFDLYPPRDIRSL